MLISKLKSKIHVNPVNLPATTSAIQEILNKLDLQSTSTIPGVFNGKWGGNGPVIESVDPSTNKVISRIQTVKL